MDYEEFYNEVWSNIGYQEISEEAQSIFDDQFAEFIFSLWRLNSNSGLLNPIISARIVVSMYNVKICK